MRILVVSDVHGHAGALAQAIEEQPTARTVIFLGDGLRQAEDAQECYSDRHFYLVPGNCDFGSDLIPAREETFGGKRFFFTHGHKYGVKYGLYTIEMAARERKADIVLFGHTHEAYQDYADGLYMLNPGSIADGSYGYVDIVTSGIVTNVVRLRR